MTLSREVKANRHSRNHDSSNRDDYLMVIFVGGSILALVAALVLL